MRFRRRPDTDEDYPIPASPEVLLRNAETREQYSLLAQSLGWPVEHVVRALEIQRCLGVPAPLAVTQLITAAAFGHPPDTFLELLGVVLATARNGEMSEQGGSFRLSTGEVFYYESDDGSPPGP